MEKVLESKSAMRTRLASLSFSQKLSILEKLRERRLAIAGRGLKRPPHPKPKTRPASDVDTTLSG
jgi:hypothetical protein